MNNFKVFLVDDDVYNLKTFISIFEEHCPDFGIYQTNNSKNALHIAAKVQPDIIITDWDMPHINGLELIEQLKNQKETRDIPIIMATGIHVSSIDLKKALAIGAVDFIKKPIDAIELVARTNSALLIAKYHKQLLAAKDAELAENSLYLVKNNQFNLDVDKKLREVLDLIGNGNPEANKVLKEVVNSMNFHIQEDSWFRFNVSFDRVHPDFNKNLTDQFPELTGTDLKLCAFVRLGMSNKDIAALLNQNPDSIKVSRSRLRKKLGMEQSQNLETYLSGF
jgi:DNA-binding NarL/FixJ family response regulator